MVNGLKLIKLNLCVGVLQKLLFLIDDVFKPQKLFVRVFVGESQDAACAAKARAFDQELCQFVVEIHFLVAVVQFKRARGHHPSTSAALKTDDVGVESFDVEPAVFMKAGLFLVMRQAVWIDARDWSKAHEEVG